MGNNEVRRVRRERLDAAWRDNRRSAAERRHRARVYVRALHCGALDFSLDLLANLGDGKWLYPYGSRNVH